VTPTPWELSKALDTAQAEIAALRTQVEQERAWKVEAMVAEERTAEQREALRAEVERLKEVQTDEIATNLRIAERLGFWREIEAGKSYEDAEVAVIIGHAITWKR